MLSFWDHWLLYAWIVPLAWGLAAVIDVLMIEWEVYENPLQATAISGVVVAVPLLFVSLPTIDPQSINTEAACIGLVSGVCYAMHLLFYYKAMFTANDAAHAETFMNTEVVFVPVLALMILGESLTGANYLSISLAATGVIILSWSARRYVTGQRRLTKFLFLAVFASSAGFIVQDILFNQTDYRTGIGFYAAGLLLGIAPLFLRQGIARTSVRFVRCFRLILCAELFTLIATAASMRAIDIGPSVSLVAVIESSRPMLIMLMCFLVWGLVRTYKLCERGTIAALRDQFSASAHKITACAFIAGGVYFASAH